MGGVRWALCLAAWMESRRLPKAAPGSGDVDLEQGWETHISLRAALAGGEPRGGRTPAGRGWCCYQFRRCVFVGTSVRRGRWPGGVTWLWSPRFASAVQVGRGRARLIGRLVLASSCPSLPANERQWGQRAAAAAGHCQPPPPPLDAQGERRGGLGLAPCDLQGALRARWKRAGSGLRTFSLTRLN